jgi:hypothetical protein
MTATSNAQANPATIIADANRPVLCGFSCMLTSIARAHGQVSSSRGSSNVFCLSQGVVEFF